MSTDFQGSLDEGVEMLFISIVDFDRREQVLRKLETLHTRMASRERERAAADEVEP
jgi:hypothetical protein